MLGTLDIVQKKLGVPPSDHWDPLTMGALTAYQTSGAGPLPMSAHGHPDPPTLINLGYYDPLEAMSPKWAAYVEGKAPHPGTVVRDLGASGNQVPQWAWLVTAALFLGVGVWTWHKSRS